MGSRYPPARCHAASDLAHLGSGLAATAHALADHLYTTCEGGFILCRTLSDRSAMAGQLRIFRRALLRVD